VSIEQYQHRPVAAPAHRSAGGSELDDWVTVVRDVSTLASQIADTPFVPDGMRGNPAAVTAAILTGREMGLGPMTSLQHIHVIKGKPGKSAEIMRAMVLAAGHEIREIEATDSRVVLEGRRSGEEMWTRVMFTADQAKRARIDLGGYPEDKLYARATTRLCRRKFADVVGGIAATVEELEDGDLDGERPALPAAPSTGDAPKKTAKRRTSTASKPPAAEEHQAPEPAPAAEPAEPAGPPLPGEAGFDDQPATEPEPVEDEPITRAQMNKLHAALNDFEITERADKLTTVSLLVQRELGSSSDLTKREASQAIDILARLAAMEDPPRQLDAFLASLEEPAESTEDGA
jgi:hypothetical protein